MAVGAINPHIPVNPIVERQEQKAEMQIKLMALLATLTADKVTKGKKKKHESAFDMFMNACLAALAANQFVLQGQVTQMQQSTAEEQKYNDDLANWQTNPNFVNKDGSHWKIGQVTAWVQGKIGAVNTEVGQESSLMGMTVDGGRLIQQLASANVSAQNQCRQTIANWRF